MSGDMFVSSIDRHYHYGDKARAECAVCCLEAERDRLRMIVERAHDHVGLDEHVLRTYATDDLVALIGVLRHDFAEADAELYRVEPVVRTARAFAEVAERPGPHDDPATQAMEYVANRRALIQAVAGLKQLGESPEATSG